MNDIGLVMLLALLVIFLVTTLQIIWFPKHGKRGIRALLRALREED